MGVGIHLKATPMTDVTRILSAIEQGDPQVAERLLPLAYDELRRLSNTSSSRRISRRHLHLGHPDSRPEAVASVCYAFRVGEPSTEFVIIRSACLWTWVPGVFVMCDPVSADLEPSSLDPQAFAAGAQAAGERRACRRRPFFDLRRIAPYDGSRLPDEAEFFCVESRDLTSQGMSFFLPSRPDFGSLVVALCEPPIRAYLVAEVIHCTDIWVYGSGLVEPVSGGARSARRDDRQREKGEPMVLVGCKLVERLEAIPESANHGD